LPQRGCRFIVIAFLLVIALTVVIYPIAAQVLVPDTIGDLWTDKGGQGYNVDDGSYWLFETIIFYFEFDVRVSYPCLRFIGPYGEVSPLCMNIRPEPEKTYSIPIYFNEERDIGEWTVILEATLEESNERVEADRLHIWITGQTTTTTITTTTELGVKFRGIVWNEPSEPYDIVVKIDEILMDPEGRLSLEDMAHLDIAESLPAPNIDWPLHKGDKVEIYARHYEYDCWSGEYSICVWVHSMENPNDGYVKKLEELKVDIHTDKGGRGLNVPDGTYYVGERVTIYCSVNSAVDDLMMALFKPNGEELILHQGSWPGGTFQTSGTAGYPLGERKVMCRARKGDDFAEDVTTFVVEEKHEECKLEITDVSIEPYPVRVGDRFRVGVTVRNIGSSTVCLIPVVADIEWYPRDSLKEHPLIGLPPPQELPPGGEIGACYVGWLEALKPGPVHLRITVSGCVGHAPPGETYCECESPEVSCTATKEYDLEILPREEFKVDIWTDRGGQGYLRPDGTYYVSEYGEVYFEANRRAYVHVYEEYPGGTIMLYEGWIDGNRVYRISGTYKTPPGDRLFVIKAEDEYGHGAYDECLVHVIAGETVTITTAITSTITETEYAEKTTYTTVHVWTTITKTKWVESSTYTTNTVTRTTTTWTTVTTTTTVTSISSYTSSTAIALTAIPATAAFLKAGRRWRKK